MGTASVTLALLLLAPCTLPPDVVPMNSRSFKIPIQRLNDSLRSQIKEILLFTSDDQGATWRQVARATPDDKAFIFYAPADGQYWFNVCVVDGQGKREPPDLYKSTPRQKVLVDTAKPVVHITADRQGQEVVVGWQIQEDHPDLASLKLEYRTPEAPAWIWYRTPIQQALTGQGQIHCPTGGAVSLRLQMTDEAGNVGMDQKEVPAAATTAPAIVTASAPGGPGLPAPTFPAVAAAVAVADGLPPPAPSPAPAAGSWPPAQPSTGVPQRPLTDTSWVPANTSRPPSTPPNSPSGDTPTGDNRYVANSLGSRDQYPPPAPRPPVPPSLAANALVPLQITNTAQVTLDYEVTHVGPSGLGSVELYLTRDDGQRWERFAEDSDLKPPMSVTLPGEGIYGLRLVLGSRAGRGRRAPQPGDLPQMRIDVDTTPPAVRLYPPQPDPHRPDALVVTWNATDRNLSLNPITLQWAERRDGVWQTIATDLPNGAPYTWRLPPTMPVGVYLRVLARDTAGNVGMDETSQPVLIDVHEPEGQLLGIVGRTGK
jgi:hypothetical protein